MLSQSHLHGSGKTFELWFDLFKDDVLAVGARSRIRFSEQTMTKKRQSSRQKSFLHGFVYFGKSLSAVNCLVRDISDTGARLKFSAPPPDTEALELCIPVKGVSFYSKVRWRSGGEIGIVFDTVATPLPAGSSESVDLANRVSRLEAEIILLTRLLQRLEEKATQMLRHSSVV